MKNLTHEVLAGDDVDPQSPSEEAPTRAANDDPRFNPFKPLDQHQEAYAFPVEVLPEAFSDWVREVARSLQVKEDLPAMLALGAASIALNGRVRVQVKPDYASPVNLFVAIVMGSGEGKSPAFRRAMAPVLKAEERLQEQERPGVAEASVHRELLQQEKKRLEDITKRLHDRTTLEAQDAKDRLASVTCELMESPEPVPPRLLLNDATPEAVQRELCDHQALGWVSSEADIVAQLMGRYGQGANFDMALKAYDGEKQSVDRVHAGHKQGRPSTLAILTTVQPVVLTDMGKHPQHLIERGLLPRFLFSVPESLMGSRMFARSSVPDSAERAYESAIEGLVEIGPVCHDSPCIRLGEEALTAYESFYNSAETKLSPDESLGYLAPFITKLRDAVARLACILYLMRYLRVPDDPEIDVNSMERAIELARYLLSHLRAAHRLMAGPPDMTRHVALWDYVRRLLADSKSLQFTKRDLLRKAAAKFRSVADLDEHLAELDRRGYIRFVPPDEHDWDVRSFVLEVSPAAKALMDRQGATKSRQTQEQTLQSREVEDELP